MANTQPGGAYIVGDKIVDANGNETTFASKESATAADDATELDAALFTEASLRKANELGMTPANFARRKKTGANGTKFTVEDVERIHAATDAADEGEE